MLQKWTGFERKRTGCCGANQFSIGKYCVRKVSPTMETWDLSLEDIKVKEDLEWLGNAGGRDYTYEELHGFIRRAPPKRDISRETDFVSPDLPRAILDAKEIFNELDQQRVRLDTFQAYYGAAGDGNVCNVQNIADFKGKVLRQTKGSGVHFMMADGGFSVEGCENLQEVLSKQLYVCQCLMALEIVRPGGHFVTKPFDLFTKFSVGLIYLMHQCFEQIAIFKPNSSLPANSERYLIGKGPRSTATTRTPSGGTCVESPPTWAERGHPRVRRAGKGEVRAEADGRGIRAVEPAHNRRPEVGRYEPGRYTVPREVDLHQDVLRGPKFRGIRRK